MWIKNTNTDEDGNCRTETMSVPGMDGEVSFEDSPVQQVKREVGEVLIESSAVVERHDSGEETDSDSDQ